MEFGERLRTLRTRKKVTQKQFAAQFKIAESTVSMYERGEREPSYEQLERFADYFDVTLDYLIGRTSGPASATKKNDHNIDPNVNIAYLGGVKHELTPEMADRIKADIELFQRMKEQWQKEQENK